MIVIDGLDADLPVVDDYLQSHHPRSVLCLPLRHQGQLRGLMYLQHGSVAGLFTRDRITTLNFLCIQAAISLENALLNQTLVQELEIQTAKREASETRLHNMVENIPGVVYQAHVQADAKTHAFPYVSPYCHAIYEVSAEAIMEGQYSFRDFEYSEDSPIIDQMLPEVAQALKPFDHQFRIVTPSGTVKWIHVISRPSLQPDGSTFWNGFVMDVSDRKAAENALVLKHNHLEALLNNIPHIAWIKDEQSRFIAVNQPFVQACGTPAEELVCKTDYDIWPDELAQAYRDDDAQVLQSGQRKVVEERIALADGTLGWLETTKTPFKDHQGTFVGTVGIAADITDRKYYEQQLKDLSERLELAIESAQIGIWDWNGEDNRVSWNKRMFEIYGVRPEEFKGRYQDWENCVHPEDLAQYEAGKRFRIQNNENKYTQEFRIVRPDSTIRYILATALIERDAQGQPIRVVGTNLDITDRKAVELALQESERRYASLAAAAPVVIYRLDKPLHISYINERWSEMTGRPSEAALGDGWMDALHPDDREEFVAHWSEIYSLEDLPDEFFMHGSEGRHLRPDGSINWFYSRLARELDEHGNVVGYIGTLTDITERKEAELALQDAQARFRRMTENVPGMIHRYVLHADGSDELTYVDSQVREIFEVEPEVALQNVNSIWERIHPDDIPQVSDKVRESAETLQPFTSEHRLILPQKGLRWIQIFSRPERLGNGDVIWDGVVIDISDRKATELALEQEVLRRNTIFNTSPDGIHILDIEGNLIEANENFYKALGYTPEEAKHLNIFDWDAKLTREEIRARLETPFSELANLTVKDESLHRRKDGSIFPVDISVCAMEWNGQLSFICISRDISERKQAEAQLQRTNEELIRATRLKDEFLANMSHELRTPLNSILGLSEALQDEVFGPLTEKQLKYLKTIEKSGTHLLDLINDILDVSKIESGQLELDLRATHMGRLCESSLAFVKQQALKKRISLKTTIPTHSLTLFIDERRIIQSLVNLLNNAVKFTPEGGCVALEVSCHQSDDNGEPFELQKPFEVVQSQHQLVWESGVLGARNYIQISVTDTGIGIAPEHLTKLFKPFSQIDSALNRKYNGTGLGLVLVKQMAELHGGTVSLTSEVGVGSCFSINLPYAPVSLSVDPAPCSDDIHPSNLAVSVEPEDSRLILLAEDNEDTIRMMVSYLEDCGHRLVVANNGLEALELAQIHHPDLVLMDIQMPEVNGLELIQRMRQDSGLKDIPIIALTALAMAGDQERCLAAGANLYLSKPIKLKQLILSIRRLLTP
ncbi:MAG: PAS domain S-box protein [Leptolyngbya sp. SIO1D8]|nr:PAS domain S-box protein [Leptolyngbya sp. SIO1D8]